MTLDKKQRENCSKVFINLLTAIFVSTILGRFVIKNPVPDWIFAGGIFTCIILFIIILTIEREDKP